MEGLFEVLVAEWKPAFLVRGLPLYMWLLIALAFLLIARLVSVSCPRARVCAEAVGRGSLR